jgi:ribosomal protein L32
MKGKFDGRIVVMPDGRAISREAFEKHLDRDKMILFGDDDAQCAIAMFGFENRALGDIPDVSELAKTAALVFALCRSTESKCPKCGKASSFARHLVGQDDPTLFHRICEACGAEWDTKESQDGR